MTPVFLDTVGLIAVWDEDDQWHSQAVPVFEALIRNGRRTVTTLSVLFECGNAASRTSYRQDVNDLRTALAAEGNLIDPTSVELDGAWFDFVRGLASDAGIVDHVSFTVMRRLGITEAFTNDRHFRAAGFTTLF